MTASSVRRISMIEGAGLMMNEELKRWWGVGMVGVLMMIVGVVRAGDGNVEKPTLLVFSVPWCFACERMDQGVWNDPDLLEYLEHGYEVHRVEEDDLQEHMDQLKVRGFPTLVLIQDGEELGRKQGYVDAEQLIDWLEDPSVKTAIRDPWSIPIGEVHDLGVELILEERLAEAGEMLVAFWVRGASSKEMTDTLRWLRRDRYPKMLTHIAQDPKAREHIKELMEIFDEDGPNADDDPRLARDWIVLSKVLDQEALLDGWIDSSLRCEQGIRMLMSQRDAFDRLVQRDRWEDAGRIASAGMWDRWIARAHGEQVGDPVCDAAPDRIVHNEQRVARERLDDFVRALGAAGREEESKMLRSKY